MGGHRFHRGQVVDDESDDFVLSQEAGREQRAGNLSGKKAADPSRIKEDGGLHAVGVKLNSGFSLPKVHSVFSSFVGEKKALVQEIGFGGLMTMHKQPKFSRLLAFWLLSNMELGSNSIVIRSGVKIEIFDADVQLVMGLPNNEHALGGSKTMFARAEHTVKAILGLGKDSEITLDYVESLLTREYRGKMSTREKNAFKVAVVIFADAYLLAPKSSVKVNHNIFHYLVDTNSIGKVNWSRYVMNVVKEASKKVKQSLSAGKKSVSLDCCLIFLEVFYLDNLDTGDLNHNYMCLPRISDYTYERVKSIISLDQETARDGKTVSFGNLKLRSSDQVVYNWGSNKTTPMAASPARNRREVPSYVMNKIIEFKTQLVAYNALYLEHVDGMVSDLEASIAEYYHDGQGCEDYPHSWSKYALIVDSVGDEACVGQITPGACSVPSGPSKNAFTESPITIETCPTERVLMGTVHNQPSHEFGSNISYSAGPAFDHSGVLDSDPSHTIFDISDKFHSFGILSCRRGRLEESFHSEEEKDGGH